MPKATIESMQKLDGEISVLDNIIKSNETMAICIHWKHVGSGADVYIPITEDHPEIRQAMKRIKARLEKEREGALKKN